MTARILIGDCRVRMAELADASVDSVVCDPPYHLTSIVKRFGAENAAPAKVGKTGAYSRASKGFMGQTWDGGDVAFDPETWAEVLRVLKPGGHLIAFSGTRTYHRMAVAIEGAGFEIRDQLAWVYGSGFPKSLDVSKAIEATETRGGSGTVQMRKAAMGDNYTECAVAGQFRKGHERALNSPRTTPPYFEPATEAAREWQGWGTALKPSWEPICLARKPLAGTVAANVLEHGTGALNIDGCRIEAQGRPLLEKLGDLPSTGIYGEGLNGSKAVGETNLGRWPANLCHDGSDEVLAGFPETGPSPQTYVRSADGFGKTSYGIGEGAGTESLNYGDSGSAARFFYCAKTTTEERGEGNNHPTVKPIALMRWLCRLVTPRGGTVLDPFMGSGSTLLAAEAEQFNAIGCEMSPDYAAIAERRLRDAGGMFAEVSVCLGEAA